MKTFVFFSALAALVLAETAIAAPRDDAAKKKAAELVQLIRDNDNKAEKLFREMAELGRKKRHGEITNCYGQIAALLALKEGAPANTTPFRLHMATARALTTPLHLHWAGLAAKHYAAALEAADTPRQKAEAILAAGQLEYDLAESDDPAPAIAKIRSALAVPELTKGDRIDLLFRYPTQIDPAVDVQAEAWKIAADEPALHGKYYENVLPPMPRAGKATLDPARGSERALEICRQGLADPVVVGGVRAKLEAREVDALVDLGRYREAEQILLAHAATTNQGARALWSRRLGDFYTEQAKRYYLPSHGPTLGKALAAYVDASLANPKDTRVVETICATALALKDYNAAQRAIARRIGQNNGVTNGWAWAQFGCIAYEKGDYAAAADAFGAAEEKLGLSSRRLYAHSLKALGRIEEAIAQLEKIEKEDNRFRKGADRYYIQYLKEKLEREGAGAGN